MLNFLAQPSFPPNFDKKKYDGVLPKCKRVVEKYDAVVEKCGRVPPKCDGVLKMYEREQSKYDGALTKYSGEPAKNNGEGIKYDGGAGLFKRGGFFFGRLGVGIVGRQHFPYFKQMEIDGVAINHRITEGGVTDLASKKEFKFEEYLLDLQPHQSEHLRGIKIVNDKGDVAYCLYDAGKIALREKVMHVAKEKGWM